MQTKILTDFFAEHPVTQYENFKASCIMQRVSKEWLRFICSIQQQALNKEKRSLFIPTLARMQILICPQSIDDVKYTVAFEKRHYLWLYNYYGANPKKIDSVHNFYNPASSDMTCMVNTPLCQAAAVGSLSLTNFLLRIGADINAKNGHEETAFAVALRYHHRQIMKKLIEAGALRYYQNESEKLDLKTYLISTLKKFKPNWVKTFNFLNHQKESKNGQKIKQVKKLIHKFLRP
jgi:hypothetical protein